MALVLGLDLETTGLDNEENVITEIGAALYDTETNTPLEFMSDVISINQEIPENIQRLTGITDEIIKDYGKPLIGVIDKLNEMSQKAEFLVIHNASFDLGFLNQLCQAIPIHCTNLPVLDTMRDLPLDEMLHPSVKLTYLCASHGFLNPFSHRALFDVLAMLKILSNYDINEVYARSISPVNEIVSLAPFAQKDEVKSHNFKWDPDRKVWFKQVKQCDYKAEDHQYNFETDMYTLP